MFGLFSGSSPSLSAQDVERLMLESPGPFLLDVREPDEYQAGHIPGSRLIPLGTLQGRVGELPTDQAIVAICGSGMRSGKAVDFLCKAGLQAVNMEGGMGAWRGPVER